MNYAPPRRSDGTQQQFRHKLPWPKDKPFRILSIDGGGIKGVLPASILAELETRFLNGQSIANYFDMIAGTSTGGIIALALSKGTTAHQARDIYLERGRHIFPVHKGWKKIAQKLGWLFQIKHDQERLKNELLRVFQDKRLDDAEVRLVIPAFEGTHGEPWIYKTPHHPDFTKDRTEKMAHVALHTAAAPTFYASVENDGYTMVDGGLWANNPVMNALFDALTCYDLDPHQVRILSLGTGDTLLSTKGAKNGGLRKWISPAYLRGKLPLVFEVAVKAQSHNANGQAGLLVGKPNFLRLDAAEGSNPIEIDDVERACTELPTVARHVVEGSGHRIQEMFLQEEAVGFVKNTAA